MQLIAYNSPLLALPSKVLKVTLPVNSSHFQHVQFRILNLILLVQFNSLRIIPFLTVFRLKNKY